MPRVWGMTVAPSGTSAWRRLFSGMRRPRASNIDRMASATSSSRTRPTPMTSAMASRVTSSWVGPRPPQQITASARVERLAAGRRPCGRGCRRPGPPEAVDAAERQLLADPGRVGVDDLPEQQFGSDGDDLAAHAGDATAVRSWAQTPAGTRADRCQRSLRRRRGGPPIAGAAQCRGPPSVTYDSPRVERRGPRRATARRPRPTRCGRPWPAAGRSRPRPPGRTS